jgi:hypothetical protein
MIRLLVYKKEKIAEPHHYTDPAVKNDFYLSFQDYFYPTTPVLAASKINFITGKEN